MHPGRTRAGWIRPGSAGGLSDADRTSAAPPPSGCEAPSAIGTRSGGVISVGVVGRWVRVPWRSVRGCAGAADNALFRTDRFSSSMKVGMPTGITAVALPGRMRQGVTCLTGSIEGSPDAPPTPIAGDPSRRPPPGDALVHCSSRRPGGGVRGARARSARGLPSRMGIDALDIPARLGPAGPHLSCLCPGCPGVRDSAGPSPRQPDPGRLLDLARSVPRCHRTRSCDTRRALVRRGARDPGSP